VGTRDAGNDSGLAGDDQRGDAAANGTIDYLRVSGSSGDADIGAYEVQQNDEIFASSFEGCLAP